MTIPVEDIGVFETPGIMVLRLDAAAKRLICFTIS
jgi:hypothetical protein